MTDRLIRFITRRYFAHGVFGELVIKIEDGVPTYHTFKSGHKTENLPE